ncbi:hypothetical protein [Macrococcus carouselicus]|uniref:Uncharacterized protein n=1 Tax=Macrococcus carouselicus TaxID=69969 RepID=A0A9Q8CLL3_9STAP|nr:hypothetical protein [Macrococcus carouselicus]TDM04495.1 hypothetical protein ERX40_04810 [Macrococcus carouselicus]
MARELTWKEIIHDYITNFFRPKAPISYAMYQSHKTLVGIPCALIMIAWLIYNLTHDVYTDSFYQLPLDKQKHLEALDSFRSNLFFLSLIGPFLVLTLSSELRMFAKRRKSAWPYVTVLIIWLFGSLLYFCISYTRDLQSQSMLPFLGMWTLIFMSNAQYVQQRLKANKSKRF